MGLSKIRQSHYKKIIKIIAYAYSKCSKVIRHCVRNRFKLISRIISRQCIVFLWNGIVKF